MVEEGCDQFTMNPNLTVQTSQGALEVIESRLAFSVHSHASEFRKIHCALGRLAWGLGPHEGFAALEGAKHADVVLSQGVNAQH